MTEFYLTRMGRTYYEHTVPEFVRQLERLNVVPGHGPGFLLIAEIR